MRRGARGIRVLVLALAAAAFAPACGQSDSIVVVKVAADPDVGAVMQLRALVSNAGDGTTRLFPGTPAADPIAFETSFSLSVPRDRTGALDIALDGLDSGGAAIANGAGSVDLHVGDNVTVAITLHAGPSLCGNGQLDADEGCDDGDRLSAGDCNYICQPRTAGPGVGGRGGTGGTAGAGGTAGTTGGAGSGGTAGTAGVAGMGGGAGNGGAAGTAGNAGTSGNGGAAGSGGRGGNGGAGGNAGTAGTSGTGGTGGMAGAGGRPCLTELLTSGGFDANNFRWTQVTNSRPLIYDQTTIPSFVPAPHTPTRLAWLGYDVVTRTPDPALRQNITIPADALQVNITGYYQIQTDESGCQCDKAFVEVDVGGNVTPLIEWNNENANTSWAFFSTFVNGTAVAGQTITLQLRAEMDDGVNTSFFFDSLSVTSDSCP